MRESEDKIKKSIEVVSQFLHKLISVLDTVCLYTIAVTLRYCQADAPTPRLICKAPTVTNS